MYESDGPAFHDHSGRWFRSDNHTPVEPHQAAALFLWSYKPIPVALTPVVREFLDGTGDLSRKPPESRERAPRRPAPHEVHAFELHRTKQFIKSEIAERVRRKYQMACNQGQVSKWIKKVRMG